MWKIAIPGLNFAVAAVQPGLPAVLYWPLAIDGQRRKSCLAQSEADLKNRARVFLGPHDRLILKAWRRGASPGALFFRTEFRRGRLGR